MPQRKLEDDLRAVWLEWSAPPDYGLWHGHKESTTVEKAEEAVGLKVEEEAAPEPADFVPAHSSATVGGGAGAASAAAKEEDEDEWGDKAKGEKKEAREKSANGDRGYVRTGRTLPRTPGKGQRARSSSVKRQGKEVTFTAQQFKEVSAVIEKAMSAQAVAQGAKIRRQQEKATSKRAAKVAEAAHKHSTLVAPMDVKKRKKRAPKTTESVAT